MAVENKIVRVRTNVGKGLVAAAVLSALAMQATTARAAVLAWDPAQTHGGTAANPIGSGGNGLWQADEGVGKWSNGPGNTSWGSGPQAANTASFGGTPGTVTIGSNVRPGGIAFTVSGYTLSTGTIATPFSTGPGTDVAAANTSTMTIDTGSAGFSTEIAAVIAGGGNGTFIGGMFTVQGTGSLTLNGSIANGQARAIVANGATLILGKTSIPADQYALGAGAAVANQTLVVQTGGTARFSGSGENQIRDKGGRITVSGTLDMNGHSETTGPGVFDSATVNFTLGSTAGANDALFLANNNTDVAVANYATTAAGSKGAATVTGSNIINIAPRSGVTSLTEGSYTLIYAASGLGTSAWTLSSSSILVGSTTYNLSLASSTATAEILTVTASPVPEPTAIGLLSLATLGLARRHRASV